MKIAIIGAGFTGLATAWNLSQHPDLLIDVFDPLEIGCGTSGVSAGLLHPYVGLHAKLNWMGREGWQETQKLLNIASSALGRPVCHPSGLLRMALTDQNRKDYTACAAKHNDVRWLEADECGRLFPQIVSTPGLWIDSGVTVYSELYLKGLWMACHATHVRKKIDDLSVLQDYDLILVTTGADAAEYPETSHLRVNKVKGQLLQLEWPSGTPPLVAPLTGQVYILMHPDKKSCFAGATYEHIFDDVEPDIKKTKNEIIPKATDMVPALKQANIICCRAGIRASTAGHIPLLQRINTKCWVLTGMGSKGLLYHALFAKRLCNTLLS